MKATIEETSDIYWHVDLQALPMIGHTLAIDSADNGTTHRVNDITHRIGGASGHSIVIHVERFPATAGGDVEHG